MAKEIPYINRDISWLDFNYRVLQEAKDPNVPLLERIKFLAIYSSNLGEFFKVRVANHKNLLRVSKKTKKEFDENHKEILIEILKIVEEQQREFSTLYGKKIAPELKKEGIRFITRKDLTEKQKDFVKDYFEENLKFYTQPILLWEDRIKPFLNNSSLYLALVMETKDKKKEYHYGIVQVPSFSVDRFIILPSDKKDTTEIILLDDIVRLYVRELFPGFNVLDTYSIKITRDAELYIDDEFEGNLLEKVKRSLKKRNIGPASRMVYDRKMPNHLLKFLKTNFSLEDIDLLAEGRYHNNFDFFKFPNFGKIHLLNENLPPLPLKSLASQKSIFKAIEEKDHFLHVPYHNYDSVVRFFEEASVDPEVETIRIVQYRVAKESRIMDALIKAAKNGKKVTTFIEIKARFDEEANLKWGEKLEKNGVKVYYSMPGLKVHSKIALVTKKTNDKVKRYAYLSTGNFHEGTATLYSDMGIFTSDVRYTQEMKLLFRFLESGKKDGIKFKHLLVGYFELKDRLKSLVKKEIAKGKKGRILLKMNSLQDKEMIALLYKASKAGVKIELIVRGMCCLVPGIKGESENINAISIVDRFLEHARIFVFGEEGKENVYLSSADWMSRNLHHRVETVFPIFNKDIKKNILDIMQLQFQDNVKARSLNFKKVNTYQTNELKPNRSQLETYHFIKNL